MNCPLGRILIVVNCPGNRRCWFPSCGRHLLCKYLTKLVYNECELFLCSVHSVTLLRVMLRNYYTNYYKLTTHNIFCNFS